MKIRTVIALALVAFLVTVLVRLPATVALAQVNTSPATVHNPSGTVWRGHAQTVTYPGVSVDDVNWRLDPLSLFAARLGGNVDFSLFGGPSSAEVFSSFAGNLAIRNGHYVVAAGSLSRQIPGDLVELGGKVDLTIDEWDFIGRLPDALRADILWENAVVVSPAAAQLGNVTITIEPNPAGHSARVDNQGGQVRISGKVDVDKQGVWRSDIRLKPNPGAPAELDSTLSLVGKRSADGSYRLRQTGRLSDFL